MIYYWSFLSIVLGVFYGIILTTPNNDVQPITAFIWGMLYYHVLCQMIKAIRNATRKEEKS